MGRSQGESHDSLLVLESGFLRKDCLHKFVGRDHLVSAVQRRGIRKICTEGYRKKASRLEEESWYG